MPCSASLTQLISVLSAQPVNLCEAALTQLGSAIQTDTRFLQPRYQLK